MRETILLVDDEPAVRRLFTVTLERVGYQVYDACNGPEALEVFDRHGESIDLLVTDMRMPFMSGADLARQLRAKRPSLRLLCISGHAGDEHGFAVDFLAKPFSRVELLAKIREILDR